MTKVHAQGGHGRFFKEQRDKAASIERAKEKIARAQEAKQRQLTEQVRKQVEIVGNKFESEIVPALAKVRIQLEQRATNGGLGKEAYILRILAVDEYAMQEIKRRMIENELIQPFAKEIDFTQYRSISFADRSTLLASILGKTPNPKRQRSILAQIQLLSKEVPRWASGTV